MSRLKKTELPQEAVKTWPERIYLQHGSYESPPLFTGSENGEITWAANNIEGNDVEYIRADLAQQAESPMTVAHGDGVEMRMHKFGEPCIECSGLKITTDAALRLRHAVEQEPGVATTFPLTSVEYWLAEAGIKVSDD